MEQKTIALELLVRSGNHTGVEQFADAEGFDESRKTEKMAEAGVYFATKVMWEEAEGGIDSERIRHAIQNRLIHDILVLPKLTNTPVPAG